MADDVDLPAAAGKAAADERAINSVTVKVQRVETIGATTIVTGQAACTSTGGSKVSARDTRLFVTLLNLGPNAVYVGPSGVATSDGFKLAVGAALTLNTTAAIHAVCATSETATLNYAETYDA